VKLWVVILVVSVARLNVFGVRPFAAIEIALTVIVAVSLFAFGIIGLLGVGSNDPFGPALPSIGRDYAQRYQAMKKRLGRQRGPKVAQIDLSRKLTEAIWHMLTRNQLFVPAGARFRLAARRLSLDMRHRSEPSHSARSPQVKGR
jgi:hypothetical protein